MGMGLNMMKTVKKIQNKHSQSFFSTQNISRFIVLTFGITTLFLFQNCTSGLETDLKTTAQNIAGTPQASDGASSTTGGTTTPPGGGLSPIAGGCSTSSGVAKNFPCSMYFNQSVDQIVMNQAQKNYSDHLMNGLIARGGWGAGNVFQVDFSIDVLNFDSSSNRFYSVDDTGDWSSDGDAIANIPAPPVGSVAGFEGGSNTCPDDGDCHYIALDKANRKLYEVYRASVSGNTLTTPGYGGIVVWPFDKIWPANLRGDVCTSADASGLSIGSMLFSADELKAGEINHAIRFILPNQRIANRTYVRPATHTTGPGDVPNVTTWAPAPVNDLTSSTFLSGLSEPGIPYGTRLRLKSSYDISSLSPSAQVVARALKKYGMILADGGNIVLTAQSDVNTAAKYADLKFYPQSLNSLKPQNFEVVPPEIPEPFPANSPFVPTVFGAMIKAKWLDCVKNP